MGSDVPDDVAAGNDNLDVASDLVSRDVAKVRQQILQAGHVRVVQPLRRG